MDKESALRLRLDGHTYQYIAGQAGVTRQRIQQLLSTPPFIRDLLIKQTGGKCQKCGILVGKSGHAHHKGSLTNNNYDDIASLQLLCISCHRRSHQAIELGLDENTI